MLVGVVLFLSFLTASEYVIYPCSGVQQGQLLGAEALAPLMHSWFGEVGAQDTVLPLAHSAHDAQSEKDSKKQI